MVRVIFIFYCYFTGCIFFECSSTFKFLLFFPKLYLSKWHWAKWHFFQKALFLHIQRICFIRWSNLLVNWTVEFCNLIQYVKKKIKIKIKNKQTKKTTRIFPEFLFLLCGLKQHWWKHESLILHIPESLISMTTVSLSPFLCAVSCKFYISM